MFILVIFITTKTGDKSNTPKLRKQWWTDRTDTHGHHRGQAGKWFTFQTGYTQNSTAIRYLGTRAVHFLPCPQCLVWGTHLTISQVSTRPSQLSEWVASTAGDVWKKTKARIWVLENDSVYALQEKGETTFFLRIRKLGASTRWARPFHREINTPVVHEAGRPPVTSGTEGKTGWGSGRSFHGSPALSMSQYGYRMLATHSRHSSLPQTLQVLS